MKCSTVLLGITLLSFSAGHSSADTLYLNRQGNGTAAAGNWDWSSDPETPTSPYPNSTLGPLMWNTSSGGSGANTAWVDGSDASITMAGGYAIYLWSDINVGNLSATGTVAASVFLTTGTGTKTLGFANGSNFEIGANQTLTVLNNVGLTGGFTKTGTGTLRFNPGATGVAPLSGNISVGEGVVRFLNNGSQNRTSSATNFAVNGGQLEFGSTAGYTIGSLSGSGGIVTAETNTGATNRNITITQSVDATYSGVIKDNGDDTLGLVVTGSKTLKLTGDNTYTGITFVNSGSLIINGNMSAATGAVTVGNGGTLSGNGRIGGATAIQANLNVGDGLGLMRFESTLSMTTTFAKVTFDLGNASERGVTYDAVNVAGALALNGGLVLNINGLFTEESWNIFDFTSVSGNFQSVTLAGSYSLSLTRSGNLWSGMSGEQLWTYDQSSGVLSVVPEPSSVLLGIMGLAVFIYRGHASANSKRLGKGICTGRRF